MSKSSSRTRANGAYVIRSAESRPRAVKAANARNGSGFAVRSQDKKLVEAVRRRRNAA